MSYKSLLLLGFSASLAASAMPIAALAQESSAEVPTILQQQDGTPSVYLPDFSYAGYDYGLSPLPQIDTAIDVADFGAIPDDGIDDSAALKAALAAAHAADGPIRVQLGAGRYQLTEILWIERSGIVLAGTGSGKGGTELFMPRPLNQVDDGGALDELREYLVRFDKRERQKNANLDVLFSEWSWSGGFISGT